MAMNGSNMRDDNRSAVHCSADMRRYGEMLERFGEGIGEPRKKPCLIECDAVRRCCSAHGRIAWPGSSLWWLIGGRSH